MADIAVPFSSLVVLAGGEMLKAGYSRDQERDADRYGLEWMTQGGFDPQGAVRFQLLSESHGLGVMSTHPTSNERVETMQRLIDLADKPGS